MAETQRQICLEGGMHTKPITRSTAEENIQKFVCSLVTKSREVFEICCL